MAYLNPDKGALREAGLSEVEGGGEIPDGSVTTAKLADSAVTPEKIGGGDLLIDSPSAVADAADEASAVTQLNALLAVLRTRGVLST